MPLMRRLRPINRAVCEVMEQRWLLSSDLSFAAPITTDVTGAAGPVYAGRFHGNSGVTDLAVSTSTAVQILNGAGDGTFSTGQTIALPADPAVGKPFLVGNFRNANTSDIVLLSQSAITGDGLVSFEAGTGAGTFVTGAASTIDDNGAGFEPITAAVGDFNGDGIADLAVLGKPVNGSGLVLAILTSDTDGTFTESADYPVAWAATSGTPLDEPMVAGIFAGSHVDIALDDGSSGHLDLFLNNGDGTFTAQAPVALTATLIVSSQLTSSGHLDLVAASGTAVTPLLGNGDGTFTTGTTVTMPTTITAMATGDIDLDGNRDVVTNAGILSGNGDGTFASAITPIPASFGGGGTVSNTLLAADITGDGRPDLVGFASGGGEVVTLVNTTAAATATAVSSADEPANPGDDVKLTATVSTALASPLPSGSVSFYDGTTLLGSNSIGTGGKAIFDAGTGLTLGAHPITAVYAGSTLFAGSTSAVFTQDVLAPTVTTLTTSENPADVGDPLAFTATVTGNDGQGDSPTGQVEFLNGTTALGSITVESDGTAVFVDPSLTAGSTASITAVYQGDDSFALSTSAAITEAVQTAPLVPVVSTSTVAGTVVAGTAIAHGTAHVTVTNQTSKLISGPIEVDLFVASEAYIDSSALAITPFVKSVKVKANASVTIVVPIKSLPSGLTAGTYLLLARASIGTGTKTIVNTGYGVTGPTIEVIAADPSLSATVQTRGLLSGAIGGTASHATAIVTVKDIGNVLVKGAVNLAVSLSTVADTTGISVTTVTPVLSFKPGSFKAVSVPFKKLPLLTDGQYFVVVTLTGPSAQTAVATTPATVQLAAPFIVLTASVGAVKGVGLAGRRDSVAITVINDGNISATGPAMITVELMPVAGGTPVDLTIYMHSLTVAAHTPKMVAIAFTFPDTISAGLYFPLATVVEAGETATASGSTQFSVGQ